MWSSPLEHLDLLLRILDAVDGPQSAFGESRRGEDVDCRFRVMAGVSNAARKELACLRSCQGLW